MLEGTYGHYVWRAATLGDKAYLCGRRKRHFLPSATRQQRDPLIESALLESDDGIVWRTRGLFQETFGDETAFLFEPDGSILAVARSGGGRNAQICRARPPYENFTRTDLDRYIGGPLLVRWGERYLVGGRKNGRQPPPSRRFIGWSTTHCTRSPRCPPEATTPIPVSSRSTTAAPWCPTIPATSATTKAKPSRPSISPNW